MVLSQQSVARISTELSEGGGALTIRVVGDFDFNLHREFLHAYQNLSPSPTRYYVDLSETRHLDSAALGMLLLLRDYCQGCSGDPRHCRIELMNANEHVARILAVSNFDKMFTIR